MSEALRLNDPAEAAETGGRPPTLSERVRSLRLPERAPKPWRAWRWLPWLMCLALAGSTTWLALKVGPPAADAGAQAVALAPHKAGANEPPAAGALAADGAAVASSGEVVLESKGYIVPVHQVQVSPKVSGMVLRLAFEEGQRVNKGDVLAQLEDVEYRSDRDRAKAMLAAVRQRLLELERGNRPEEVEATRAELAEAEAQREQLYLEWKRNISLKTGNALAARDYEQAYSAYKAMDRRVEKLRQNFKLMVEGARKERIEAARGEVGQAEADLAKAQWRLDSCVVRAPVSGTILTKKAEEGNIVNPIAFNISASLCEMADLSDLEVDMNVQERDVGKVFKGQRCRIRPEAFPERSYDGAVSRLMPIGDRAKGAVPVRVKVVVPKDEEGVYLKPEMSAVVSFLRR